VAVDAVAIANTEHPQPLDAAQVLHTNEAVLVWLGLRGDETLPCFHCEGLHD
jgi:hypothetical protein